MRFAYDLHGVITEAPEIYKLTMRMQVANYHQVFVISGSPIVKLVEELSKLGFIRGRDYTELYSVVGHLIGRGHSHTIDDNGEFWFDEDLWWQSKAEICLVEHIDVLYDNETRYGDHFHGDHPTRFVLTEWLPRILGTIPGTKPG